MSTDATPANVGCNDGLGRNVEANSLTDARIGEIAFAVLRVHASDKLWRALTYDSGPYDVTKPNLALRDLASAFYCAGIAAGVAASKPFTNRVMAQRDACADEIEARTPLDATRIEELWDQANESWGASIGGPDEYVLFARAIEREHGIAAQLLAHLPACGRSGGAQG